jgi:hypothetical protein
MRKTTIRLQGRSSSGSRSSGSGRKKNNSHGRRRRLSKANDHPSAGNGHLSAND